MRWTPSLSWRILGIVAGMGPGAAAPLALVLPAVGLMSFPLRGPGPAGLWYVPTVGCRGMVMCGMLLGSCVYIALASRGTTGVEGWLYREYVGVVADCGTEKLAR